MACRSWSFATAAFDSVFHVCGGLFAYHLRGVTKKIERGINMGYLLYIAGTVLYYFGFAIFRKMEFAPDSWEMWVIVAAFIFGTFCIRAGVDAVLRGRKK